ncbi:Hypothetical predicted protein [Paramuricea clavata]|uniref:Uncharacterized protein n=1 Tax=Paramuricea clavata TaxID=317549 RepID=A0A7D9EFZ4_PARCT|nr:Hypothetical predicted protein [Paramuricea clavata]
MTSESEAKAVIYKKTAEYLDSGVQMIFEDSDSGVQWYLEEDAPEPVKPAKRRKLVSEEISEIKSHANILTTEHDKKEVLRVFVSDFAGQSIYYDTHGCFVKPHCPYVLVHNLSLEFDKPAVPRFKASEEEEEIEMNNPHLNTNLDNFTSWLKFLQGLGEYQDQQFPYKSGHCTTANGENFRLPPVLIVLTHSDEVKGNDSKINCVRKRIKKVLSGGKYENVDPQFFLIDNTLENDDGDDVRKLRRKLFDLSNGVLDQEISMPVKWLDFEVALSRKLLPDSKYIPVDEAKQEAEACGVGEFDQAIKFLHRQVAPAMAPGKELEASKTELNVPSLFVTFPRKLVPISLFTKLQVKLISEWKKRFPNQQATPSFYCNYSLLPLIIDGDVYDVCLIDLHEFIKVAVFPKQDGYHFKFASHLLATLKKCLDDLKSPDQLLFSMTSYDLEVECTCCFGKEEIKCSRHREIQCHSDRCGHRHFWKLSDLQRFYNDKSPAVCRLDKHSSKVFDIKSVKIWLNSDAIGSEKPTQKSKKSSKESPMCSSCASKDETPLSSDRDKWPIGKIEIGCFQQICKLLDFANRSKEPLVSALGGFNQTEAAYIGITYEAKGGLGTAEEVLFKWGSRNHENNVGALKKIVQYTLQRIDVVDEIEKWENSSVCHGCELPRLGLRGGILQILGGNNELLSHTASVKNK